MAIWVTNDISKLMGRFSGLTLTINNFLTPKKNIRPGISLLNLNLLAF